MRLIDADEIKKQFDPNTWQGEMMIDIANGLPTAYDVDNVVEQLQHKAWKTKTIQMPRYEVGKRDAYYDALSIVKGAVKDE